MTHFKLWVCSLFVGVFYSYSASAEPLPSSVEYALRDLERGSSTLQSTCHILNSYEAQHVLRRVRRVSQQLRQIEYQLNHIGPGPVGKIGWYPVNGQECYSYCQSIGLFSGVSVEGAQCVSGENRAASAIGKIAFTHGCWPDCSAQTVSRAVSVGGYCYNPAQSKDNDRTDITVGCFCRR